MKYFRRQVIALTKSMTQFAETNDNSIKDMNQFVETSDTFNQIYRSNLKRQVIISKSVEVICRDNYRFIQEHKKSRISHYNIKYTSVFELFRHFFNYSNVF